MPSGLVGDVASHHRSARDHTNLLNNHRNTWWFEKCYDCCYCYVPTVQEEGAPPLAVAEAQRWKETHNLEGVPVVKYDWTYTTCYRGSLSDSPAPPQEPAGLDRSMQLVRA